jgi:peroxiredoxin
LSVTDAVQISIQVRRLLREGIALVPVDLPEDFPFTSFKGLGGGGSNVVALPLQLSDNPAPAGGVAGITQSFIGPSGFGFAVASDFVVGLIDPAKVAGEIEKRKIRVHVSVFGHGGTVTYGLRFTSGPTLTFQTGTVEVSGRVAVETGTWWAPNGFVSFKQPLTLVLDGSTQRIDVVTAGDPSVDESWFIPHGTAVNAVKNGIADALAGIRPTVRHVFEDARLRLANALRTFEGSASVDYTQVDVRPDGVVVRGQVATANRIAPVVEVHEVSAGGPLTAFQSWIPGGRIDRFTWSWVEYPPESPGPWSGVARMETLTHRFLFDRPAGITSASEVCLRIEGERILPDGRVEAVDAGFVCLPPAPVFGLNAPSWFAPATVPLWKPGLPATTRLRDAIGAHISVYNDRPQEQLTQNTLVFFPDWRSDAPFDALARALTAARRPMLPAVLIVLPTEAFDMPRREVEARLGRFPPVIASRVQVAEDTESGWSQTFGVDARPALFLINARGEFVWNGGGAIDPARITAALESLMVPAPRPRFQPLRMKVAAGDRAPDVLFRDDRGNEGALHRFLGRSVTLTFWQSWSKPCLDELRRLETLLHDVGHTDAAVVAFHGGPAPKSFDAIRRQHGLSFPIVDDAEHRVARRFGVRCWPTTISIDAEGRIERVQLGSMKEAHRSVAQ